MAAHSSSVDTFKGFYTSKHDFNLFDHYTKK